MKLKPVIYRFGLVPTATGLVAVIPIVVAFLNGFTRPERAVLVFIGLVLLGCQRLFFVRLDGDQMEIRNLVFTHHVSLSERSTMVCIQVLGAYVELSGKRIQIMGARLDTRGHRGRVTPKYYEFINEVRYRTPADGARLHLSERPRPETHT